MAAERERRGLRAPRWTAAALGTAVSLVGLLSLPATAAEFTLPSTTPRTVVEESAAELTLLSAPSGAGLVRQGDDYRVRVTVTNSGSTPTAELTIALHVAGATSATRDELATWFSSEAAEAPSDLTTISSATLSPLDPGSSAVLDLAVSGNRPGLSGDFGTRIALVTANEGEGSTTASDRTALVWVPTNAAVPAIDTTFVAALSTPGNRSALLSSDDIAALTSDAGSLTRTLDAVAGRPVLVGIDPRVIASIRALGTSAPESAVVFLERLGRIPNETFLLPWADADPVATLAAEGIALPPPEGVGAAASSSSAGDGEASPEPTPDDGGDGDGDGPEDVAEAEAAASAALLAELSNWPVTLTGWSWLGDTGLDDDAVAALVNDGMVTSVVPTTAIDGLPALSNSGATLLGADDAVAAAAQRASLADSQQAHDSALAHLGALLAASASADTPFALVSLSREQLASSDRLVSTIAQTIMLPWADPAQASQALTPATATGDLTTSPIDELRSAAISNALAAERSDRRFAQIAEPSWFITDERRLELLAALSLGWGTRSTIELDRYVVDSAALRSSVQVVESSAILLLADRTSLPITVQNDLDVAVRVFVHVDPDTGRLRVLDSDVETLVEPRSQTRAVVPVESVTNGDVRITVSVRDAEGLELGTPRRVELTLQAGWETVGVLIVGGATLLLFVVGIARDLRKRRRRREAERLERENGGEEHPDLDATSAAHE